MRGYLVAGNWKMNGNNAANAELVDGIVAGMRQSDSVELLICPPFPYLAAQKFSEWMRLQNIEKKMRFSSCQFFDK